MQATQDVELEVPGQNANTDREMTTETTYGHQDALPPLPLPALEQTLEAYVKSCEPLLTPAELEHTKA
ncbi:hypothetical protein SPRG_18193, partial [Saprolegnia parasitica CBS 223.65]